jgi:hypothetical protein
MPLFHVFSSPSLIIHPVCIVGTANRLIMLTVNRCPLFIYGLFNITDSNSDCMAYICSMVVNSELEKMWMKAVVALI